MSGKKMVSAKMGNRTVERLEEYAEKEGISRSQATERMCKQGLDVEESDMRLIPVETDGGTKMENQLQKNGEKVENVKQELKSELENQQQQQTQAQILNGLTVAGLLFIALELLIGLPVWFVLSAGSLLGFTLVLVMWVVYHD